MDITTNVKSGVGLVLAGGGGKGAYQFGVLKALKEKGYLKDVTAIAGSSIGAVNAMLYAMDDMELMDKAWADMDMDVIFDVDLELLLNNRAFFSRDEMIKMMGKFIDFNKLKNNVPFDIYVTICKLDSTSKKLSTEYRKLSDHDVPTIQQILLASTALPLVYEAVEIEGNYYRDGGICDNEPVKPLYDAGIRDFIVIGQKKGKVFNESKWPGATFTTIYPSYDLGDLVTGTLNFTDKSKELRERLGYKDGLRAINTKFLKDEHFIKMEPILAKADYDEVTMQIRQENAYDTMSAKVNSHMDYFNKLAEKYDKY